MEDSFIGLNLIVILVVGLIIFAYLVMLIRKRWKNNFLHQPIDKPKAPEGNPDKTEKP